MCFLTFYFSAPIRMATLELSEPLRAALNDAVVAATREALVTARTEQR